MPQFADGIKVCAKHKPHCGESVAGGVKCYVLANARLCNPLAYDNINVCRHGHIGENKLAVGLFGHPIFGCVRNLAIGLDVAYKNMMFQCRKYMALKELYVLW